MRLDVAMLGGVPTVDRAGPWLLPDTTHTMPYLLTTSEIISPKRLYRKINCEVKINALVKYCTNPECAQCECSP